MHSVFESYRLAGLYEFTSIESLIFAIDIIQIYSAFSGIEADFGFSENSIQPAVDFMFWMGNFILIFLMRLGKTVLLF